MTLKQFDVFVQDKPGELARITEILAKKAVNIRGIATDFGQGKPVVHVITDDDVTTRTALTAAGQDFLEKEIIVVALQDKPGELHKLTKRLARGGVNIESLYILGAKTPIEEVAITVDKMGPAKELLDYS
ncbi:MAG TPA: hypothetical protein VLH13_02550 [Methanomassiliicoccales archaeon]|nr:hypothetical protein [Methanomassiliicoccales archaeon]